MYVCAGLCVVEYNMFCVLTPKLPFHHVPVSDSCIYTRDLFDLLQLLDISVQAFRWRDTYNTFKIMYVRGLNLICEIAVKPNGELYGNVHVHVGNMCFDQHKSIPFQTHLYFIVSLIIAKMAKSSAGQSALNYHAIIVVLYILSC